MTDEERTTPTPERDERTGQAAAAARIQHQARWVEEQLRVAIERGDFDDLPGAGKPIEGLGTEHDPDWWLKKLVEREQVVLLPLSVELRKEDAALDEVLDAIAFEDGVRSKVEDFNRRVLRARYSLQPGPPLVTMPRDVDATLEAWRERRTTRLEALRLERATRDAAVPPRRRWWRRRSS